MIGTRYTEELINDYVTKGLWDPDLLINDLLDRCACDYPDEEAVVDQRTRLTWREVSQRVDRIARSLVELGYKKDEVLATQLYNCVEYFLLFFACEKAGVVMATSQPTFRQAEMEPILRQTRAKGIVIPYNFRNFDYFAMAQELQVEQPGLKHIIVIGDEVPEGALSLQEMMSRETDGTELPQVRFKPFEVTRIFNTSGTTGTPKCIERPVAPRMLTGKVLVQRLGLKHDDILAAGWNLAAGGSELLCNVSVPWVGCKMINIEQFKPELVCELLEREKVSVLAAVPAELVRLVAYPHLDKYDFSSLRMIFTGTQLLTPELGARAEEKMGCPMVIIFGSGDTGPICTTTFGDPPEIRLRTVGRPVDGNEVKIVDSEGQPVPAGEVGEVCVSGANTVSGYYRSAELTMQSWQDGWFCTGDAGKKDAEGHITLLGRKRDVIIRGGQNIYPFEIEGILMQHPKIKDLAIVGMPDAEMGEKQCAYVVPKAGQSFELEEMAGFLKSQKVASYKIPERLEIMSELPLVPAGNKVDKARLEEDIAGKLKEEQGG
ncbi:AMP-binding protein [Bacteroidota bacterium]